MFDWDDHLDLARTLVSQPSEAAQHSAISRAYYATYCIARNWLTQRGCQFASTREVHQRVWNEFIYTTQAGVWADVGPTELTIARRAGNLGHKLLRARRLADYENELHDLTRLVRSEMLRAEQLRNALRYLETPTTTG